MRRDMDSAFWHIDLFIFIRSSVGAPRRGTSCKKAYTWVSRGIWAEYRKGWSGASSECGRVRGIVAKCRGRRAIYAPREPTSLRYIALTTSWNIATSMATRRGLLLAIIVTYSIFPASTATYLRARLLLACSLARLSLCSLLCPASLCPIISLPMDHSSAKLRRGAVYVHYNIIIAMAWHDVTARWGMAGT